MLFDVYGDFAIEDGRSGSIRLTALVRLAATLGFRATGVRAAVARMARDNWLRAERHGRQSTYHLTQPGRRLVEDGRRRIFGTPETDWDGQWCIVSLSVPESRREVRDRLRKELIWLGFGSPSSGLYISPRDHQPSVERLAEELDALTYVHIYSAAARRPADPRDLVALAWSDLDALNARYADFVARFSRRLAPTRAAIRERGLADEDAFRLRFELASHFRHCLYADPELPPRLAPAGWNGIEARRLFLEFHALVTPGGLRFFDMTCHKSDTVVR
jgi:phenylacetic acid degradation operon negative regulatory protein